MEITNQPINEQFHKELIHWHLNDCAIFLILVVFVWDTWFDQKQDETEQSEAFVH